MKKYLFYLLMLVPSAAFGVESLNPSGMLLRSCPDGYITIERPAVSVATNCGSLATDIGNATSCNSDAPGFSCFMYAPVGVSYVDSSDTYEFIEPCPLTE